jgi:flagellar L-ring protein precursor FlgH
MNSFKILLVSVLVLLIATDCLAQQRPLYDSVRGTSLFSDVKAWQVGDVITIIIRESSSATSSASTETAFQNGVSGGPGTGILDLVPSWGLDYENTYKGDGATQRQGKLSAQISARIVEVLPNSQYRIEGRRDTRINGEFEMIVLTGIIRAHDITIDNSILSSQVADAQITYDGKGDVGNASSPGLFTKLVNWLF